MLPSKIGKFSLQEHILSLNEEDRKVFIQYKDDQEVSYTLISQADGVVLQFADPMNGKIQWVETYEFLDNAIESLKSSCAKHHAAQMEEAMVHIRQKGLTEDFSSYLATLIEQTMKNESAYYEADALWKVIEVLGKQYKIFDYLNTKENKVTI